MPRSRRRPQPKCTGAPESRQDRQAATPTAVCCAALRRWRILASGAHRDGRDRGMASELHTPIIQLVLDGEATAIDLGALQGLWSDEQYLRLTDQTNRLLELTDGVIEVLPRPTRKHQAISRLLFLALLARVQPS